REHGGDFARMRDAEARSVARLLVGPTARNLVRVFELRQRLREQARHDAEPVRRVHVIGAGTMGGDIAAWCALRGCRVSLQDRETDLIAPAVRRAARLFERRLRDRRAVRDALDRLIPDPAGDGVTGADLVLEAVPEKLELKQSLLRELEPRLPPGALFATNTSSLPLERIGEALAHPRRLVGLHFFNPVAKMPLLEVVVGAQTAPGVRARALAFARTLDKLPVAVASRPGFLVNRVLMPYLLEAVRLVEEGHTPETVDRAAEDFGMPMGPLALADAVGLDICADVGAVLAREIPGMPALPARLQQLVEAGHTGRKSGRGFYVHGTRRSRRSRPGPVDDELRDRLVLALINACVAALREEVVADADSLDGAVIFGTGFAPFRGGPLHYARDQGAEDLRQRLEVLAARHGGHLRPDPGWADL
ncbi:MAG: 3-hydroxyacyl-CoA dehydrogenase family protein, partial [Candidatus Competibacterales bacterium]|nr:3-hydroxyacyl-CoA dehydrogenase family protein [Candidatus Competibacterales bacterium]